MAVYSTNEFRGGMKILLDGDPYAILENEYVKPGKGQAFNRVKIRNLKTGRVVERTFKSGDTATGGQKPAKLETGAVVRVPLFINEGEVIRVDTRSRTYVSRVKQ